MTGLDKGDRKMKMQGVLKDDISMDVGKHFTVVDYKAEKIQKELDEHRQLLERESRTTVGAVKRLIQKVSTLNVNETFRARPNSGSLGSHRLPSRRIRSGLRKSNAVRQNSNLSGDQL